MSGPLDSDRILNDAATRARRRFEVPVLVAALLVVPVIFIEERATSPEWLTVAYWANWAIWAAFAVEYLTVVALAENKRAYTRSAWLDVLVIVMSFPLLPSLLTTTRLLRLTRLARVLRLLRFFRLATILTRGAKATGEVFRKRGLGYMAVLTLIVALGLGGLFAMFEASNIFDGLWWAVVTVTTVGYGDMFPVTTGGRIAAGLLMLLGIGFVAFITAAVAAHFVGEDEDDVVAEVKRLHARLDRIEAALGVDSQSQTEEQSFQRIDSR